MVASYDESKAIRVAEKDLQIGSVKLYKTFLGADFNGEGSGEDPNAASEEGDADEGAYTQEARGIDPISGLDENLPIPDLSRFPQERGRRKTWFGKIFQSLSVRKSHISILPDNKRRRLNCAVYDFDYRIYHSIGVTAKIQKKMWYGGWAKVKYWSPGTILVGYRYALVRYPYPGDMYKRTTAVVDMVAQHIHGVVAETRSDFLDYLPRPAWFKKTLFNSTSPIYALTKKALTLEDVLKVAKPMIHSLVRSQAGASWVDNEATLREKLNPKLNREQLDWAISWLKQSEFVPTQTPIYAEDGIYVLYKGGWYSNMKDESEVDVALNEGFGSFVLKINMGVKNGVPQFQKGPVVPDVNVGWHNNMPTVGSASVKLGSAQLEFGKDDSAGKLIDGDFFAIAYGGGWVGYNLVW